MPLSPETARRVAAAREQVQHTCSCGVIFAGIRQARYHSHACRQKAYLERHPREPKPRGRPRKLP